MKEIDTSSWGEFRVGDLFPEIERATRRTVNSYTEGDVPYVTNSTFNNGITGYLEPKSSTDIERGRCISINTVDGYAFWQEQDFLANSSGNGLLMLRRDDLNRDRALFVCAAITTALEASYAVMITKDVVRDVTIRLPATSDGDPDWDYMEQAMSDSMAKQERELDALMIATEAPETLVETSDWGEFKVGSLFRISPTRAYKAINAQLFDEDGSIPVIVNSSLNNGVGGYTTRPTTERGGIITFSDTTTSEAVFYQAEDFVGYPHVQGMYPTGKYANQWNEERLLFFLSVFKKAAMLRAFDYGDKFTRELAASITVRLPVTLGGDLDWDYMEQTIQVVMAERETALDSLQVLAVGT